MLPVTAHYSVFTSPTGLSVGIEVTEKTYSILLKHTKPKASVLKLSIADFDKLIIEAKNIKRLINLIKGQLQTFATSGESYERDSSDPISIPEDSHSRDSTNFSPEDITTSDSGYAS